MLLNFYWDHHFVSSSLSSTKISHFRKSGNCFIHNTNAENIVWDFHITQHIGLQFILKHVENISLFYSLFTYTNNGTNFRCCSLEFSFCWAYICSTIYPPYIVPALLRWGVWVQNYIHTLIVAWLFFCCPRYWSGIVAGFISPITGRYQSWFYGHLFAWLVTQSVDNLLTWLVSSGSKTVGSNPSKNIHNNFE